MVKFYYCNRATAQVLLFNFCLFLLQYLFHHQYIWIQREKNKNWTKAKAERYWLWLKFPFGCCHHCLLCAKPLNLFCFGSIDKKRNKAKQQKRRHTKSHRNMCNLYTKRRLSADKLLVCTRIEFDWYIHLLRKITKK